jgi:polyhydroxyalkanoate synthesis regulator phasin
MSELPAIGPSKEKIEKMWKGYPLFINLYSVWMDSISDFQNLSFEAINKMRDKMVDMDGEISPERNKEVYNVWIETYSDTFKEFLRTDHFARDMSKFMSGFIEVQKYNREMLEENILRPMNLPTNTDIDELNMELYSLKKTVRELTRKVNELSQEK